MTILFYILVSLVVTAVCWLGYEMTRAQFVDDEFKPVPKQRDGIAPGVGESVNPDYKIKNPHILNLHWKSEIPKASHRIHSK